MQKDSPVSFHNEMLHIIILCTLIPLCLIAFAFFVFSCVYIDTAVLEENRSDNEKICRDLESVYKIYSGELNSLAFNFDLDFLKKTDGGLLQLHTLLIQFMNRQGNMADFFLFDDDYKVQISSASLVNSFMPPEVGENWGLCRKMNVSEDKTRCIFFNNSLLIGRKIKQGYAVFVIPEQYFESNILEHLSSALILNQYNDICISSAESFTGEFRKLNPKVVEAEEFFSFKNNWYFKTSTPIELGDDLFSVCTFSSIKRLVLTLIFEVFFLLVLIGLSGVVSFFVARRATERKTASITRIVDCLTEVQKGNLAKRMDIDSMDEFRLIADSYNRMTESIVNLIQKNKEITKETVTAQIKQLESQFNPHFLFNTLEIIKYMAKLDPDNVPVIINNLSKLLRYSITVEDYDITLKDDLEYTKNYLSIQKFRFMKRFNYNLEIDDNALECIVPKLLIQPLIENAIAYNLSGSTGSGRRMLDVTIKAFLQDNKLHMCVIDNGIGINAEKIEEIRKLLSQTELKSNHLGLYNIYRRIKLIHGNSAGFSIESVPSEGTTVSLYFPAKKYDGGMNV